jgi:hypothetical protein
MRLATRYSVQYYQNLVEGIRSALAGGWFATLKWRVFARLAEGA